jgi:NADH dehydrogenase
VLAPPGSEGLAVGPGQIRRRLEGGAVVGNALATTGRHRVVVVGGGFGGLNVTRALDGADVDLTVVDRTNHHLFQPLLYQVATGILPPGLIAPALRSVIKKQGNARALLGDVYDLDLDAKVVRAHGPDGRAVDLPYDTLVVAAGATHSYFGKNQFAEFAPGMKTVEDARYLRDGILSKFEMAEMATDRAERAEWLTFVVIGAGPTGVELVGQIAELAHTVLPRDYGRSIPARRASSCLRAHRRSCRRSTRSCRPTAARC